MHRWYAQNADVSNPKLRQLPIGLNCFEQAPELHEAIKTRSAARHRAGVKGRLVEDAIGEPDDGSRKGVWVNFGNTHATRRAGNQPPMFFVAWAPDYLGGISESRLSGITAQAKRKVAWEHFCGGNGKKPKPWATCVVKNQKNHVRNNPHLVKYYGRVAGHRYVAAPRGNGLDTHRFWEALYLGCVPIVEKGPLDKLYASVGALVVKGWNQVTPALLEKEYPRLRAVARNASGLLSPKHWVAEIERDRRAAAAEAAVDRNRCWGPSKARR